MADRRTAAPEGALERLKLRLGGAWHDRPGWARNTVVLALTGSLLALLALPLAVPVAGTVRSRTDGPALNGALARTGALLAVFSLLLAAGVLLS